MQHLDAELVLQRLNASRYRGLDNMEPGRRAREAHFFGDSDEVLQLPQLHAPTHVLGSRSERSADDALSLSRFLIAASKKHRWT